MAYKKRGHALWQQQYWEGDPHVPPSSFQSRKVKNAINFGFIQTAGIFSLVSIEVGI